MLCRFPHPVGVYAPRARDGDALHKTGDTVSLVELERRISILMHAEFARPALRIHGSLEHYVLPQDIDSDIRVMCYRWSTAYEGAVARLQEDALFFSYAAECASWEHKILTRVAGYAARIFVPSETL